MCHFDSWLQSGNLDNSAIMFSLQASSWRSGSSLFGDLLSHYPGTFYAFEPLHAISRNRISGETKAGERVTIYARRLLKGYLNCVPSAAIDKYLRHGFKTSKNFR